MGFIWDFLLAHKETYRIGQHLENMARRLFVDREGEIQVLIRRRIIPNISPAWTLHLESKARATAQCWRGCSTPLYSSSVRRKSLFLLNPTVNSFTGNHAADWSRTFRFSSRMSRCIYLSLCFDQPPCSTCRDSTGWAVPAFNTKEFSLCLIRSENLVLHGMRILQVHFVKLLCPLIRSGFRLATLTPLPSQITSSQLAKNKTKRKPLSSLTLLFSVEFWFLIKMWI